MNSQPKPHPRVLFIAPALGLTSGWGRMVYEVVKQFKEKSVPFTMCADNIDADFNALPFIPLAKGLRGFIANFFTVRKLAREYDVVHAFDGWPYALYGYAAVLGTKKKLFITGVGTYSVAPLTSPLKSIFLKRAYLRAVEIMCISSYTQKRILEILPAAKTSVVHMGLTSLPSMPEADLKKQRHERSLEEHSPILLTVGAIKHRKGQLETTEAVALLIKKYPKLLYAIVGSDRDNVYVDKIKKCIQKKHLENNVRIIPDVASDQELALFYQGCDIFILASQNSADNHFEGFGLVLLEAAQFGKPGIGTRDCGVEDAVVNGKTGFLVPQGHPDSIAKAIDLILSGDKKTFSSNAREFARSFSWSGMADRYLAAYTTL